MRFIRFTTFSCLPLIATVIVGVPVAKGAPTFSITAADVTMPRNGAAYSQFNITTIPITGTIVLSCGYSGTLALSNLPVCPLTPPRAYPVASGGTLNGTVAFLPPNVAIPAATPAIGVILGGLLVLGIAVRRRRCWFLATGMPAILALLTLSLFSGCGGSSGFSMPRGTYPYTITAVNSPAAGEGPSYMTSVIIKVTIP